MHGTSDNDNSKEIQLMLHSLLIYIYLVCINLNILVLCKSHIIEHLWKCKYEILNQAFEDNQFSLFIVRNWKIAYSPKLNLFSFYSFVQFEYQLILDIPNISSKNTSKYNTNLCFVSRNKITYLASILSANSEQTHHTPVSYL